MPTLRDTKWIYNQTRATSDLSVPRPAVPRGFSPELLGVDGTIRGGLRPHAGFRLAHELNFYGYSKSPYTSVSHNATSIVTDFFPVTFKKGFKTAYGFVYRVKNEASSRADVFIEYYDPDDSVWYTPTAPNGTSDASTTNETNNLLMYDLTGELITAEMDVQVFGRLIYVFVKGRSPSLFYIDLGEDNTDDGSGADNIDAITVVGVTGSNSGTGNTGLPGPGLKPSLLSGPDAQDIGSMDDETNANRPGKGQIVLTGTAPAQSGLFGESGIYASTSNSFFRPTQGTSLGDSNLNIATEGGGVVDGAEATPVATQATLSLVNSVKTRSYDPVTVVPVYTDIRASSRILVIIVADKNNNGSNTNEVSTVKFNNASDITLEQIENVGRDDYQKIYAYQTNEATQANQDSSAALTTNHNLAYTNCIEVTFADSKAPVSGRVYVYEVTNCPQGDTNIIAQSSASLDSGSDNVWGFTAHDNATHTSNTISINCGGLASSAGTSTFDTDGSTGFNILNSATQGPTDSTGARIETLTNAFKQSNVNTSLVGQIVIGTDSVSTLNSQNVKLPNFTDATPATVTGAKFVFDGSVSTPDMSADASPVVAGSGATATVTVGISGLSTRQAFAQKLQYCINKVTTAGSTSAVHMRALNPSTTGAINIIPEDNALYQGLNGSGSDFTRFTIDSGTHGSAAITAQNLAGGEDGFDETENFAVQGSVRPFAFITQLSNTNYQGVSYDLQMTSNLAASGGDNWSTNYAPIQMNLSIQPKGPTVFPGTASANWKTDYTANTEAKKFVDNASVEMLSPTNDGSGLDEVSSELVMKWRLRNSGGDGEIPVEAVVYDVYLNPEDGAAMLMIAEGIPHTGTISSNQQYTIQRAAAPHVTVFSKGRLNQGSQHKCVVVARLKGSTFNVIETGKSTGKHATPVIFKTGVADLTAKEIGAGDYAFAYVLYDSRTGRKTSLSDVVNLDDVNFPTRDILFNQETGEVVDDIGQCCSQDQDPSGGECEFECDTRLVGQRRFVALEVTYDSSKYDRAYVYRSVRTEDAGGTFTAGYLQLDRIITLTDYATSSQPSGPNSDFKKSIYYYTKEDKGLVWQPSYLGDSSLDEQMPYGGTAAMYDNTLVVANLNNQPASTTDENRPLDEVRGIGEVRYSSIGEYSPELFPPLNRYVPPDPNNEIIKIHKVGPYLIGLARDRAYHFRRENGFVTIREIHEGLVGVVNPLASDVAGSSVYTISSKGVRIIDSNGQFQSMNVLDRQIKEKFQDDFDNLQVAFDPFISCLFFFKPPSYSSKKKSSNGEATIAWFETSMVSELDDLPFDQVKQGAWPRDETIANIHVGDSGGSTNTITKRVTNYASDTVNRALWLQNAPAHDNATDCNSTVQKTSTAQTVDNWRPRIWVANHKRGRGRVINGAVSTSELGHSLLDTQEDRQFDISGTPSGTTITLNTSTFKVGANSEGSKIYVAKGSNQTHIGKSYTIQKVVGAADGNTCVVTTIESVDADGPSTWERVSLSPVHFRAVGHNCGVSSTQDDMTAMDVTNYHRVKQVNDLMATFIDVSGHASTEATLDAYYLGVLFVGSEEEPTHSAQPLDSNGNVFDSITSTVESLYPAVFGTSDTFSGSQGVLGVSLSPGVECFCSDLDYRLLSFRVDGKIQPSETASLSDIDS